MAGEPSESIEVSFDRSAVVGVLVNTFTESGASTGVADRVRIGGALATFDRFLQFDTLSVNLDPTSVSSSSADAAALQSVSDEMTRLLNQFPD
jgi:hypothetical protein